MEWNRVKIEICELTERKIEKMKLEMAPMEGLTTYIYRNAYARYYGNIDKYYTPFLSLHQDKEFSTKELREILPENNNGLNLVPQVLTNSAENFRRAAMEIKALGYEEININLGCPSGTVTTKKKGAGMLADPKYVERFLDGVFEKTLVKVSVKTRLGVESVEEWESLLEIYNKFPLEELIVHARVREDYYQKPVHWDAFGKALAESKNPVCYNGDIYTMEDYIRLGQKFPTLQAVMLGRGLLSNPGLAMEIKNEADRDGLTDSITRLKAFHDDIYESYKNLLSDDRNVLFKMKELWSYFIQCFPGQSKVNKQIKKSKDCAEYESSIRILFQSMDN